MHSCRKPFRVALLGSVLALAALTPAIGANLSRADWQRIRAAEGNRPAALRPKSGSAPARSSSAYTDLHDFAGGPGDGSSSTANVTLNSGDIFGTTGFGGANNGGTIFKLAQDGTETLLHSFSGNDGLDPDGAVIVLANGDIYGTTNSGGATNNGVLFKLSAAGKYKILHNFDGTNDGDFIRGDLIRDKLHNFYGTALFGGPGGSGTVYRYGSDGTFKVLHAFDGTTDGEYPEHGVVSDSAGNLYGVTAFGPGTDGQGTVYRVAPDGKFKTLYAFSGGSDGGFLYGGLDIDKNGNLYGSTVDGGANGAGTVFKLAPDGTLTTLYNFTGGADGGSPEGDMLHVGKNLYSEASGGGDANCQCGVVYEITSKGKEKVLHTFIGSDGAGYSEGLVKGNHAFYGTTSSGGADGNGVVFRVTK